MIKLRIFNIQKDNETDCNTVSMCHEKKAHVILKDYSADEFHQWWIESCDGSCEREMDVSDRVAETLGSFLKDGTVKYPYDSRGSEYEYEIDDEQS